MKIYAKGTRPWEQAPSVNLSVEEVIKQYEKGFAGTYLDPEQRDLFTQISKETGGFTNVEDAANAYGWYGSFEGQLVIPFVHILENLPGSWPGPAQGRGDCVSHSNKNALMGTLVCEAVSDRPDEETGVLEAIPAISVDGLRAGAFSTEVFYWYRGHGGDGWYCEASANVTIKQAGAVIRGPLEGSDIDLTKYSANLAGKWGRTAPPDSIGSLLNKNLLRTAARVTTFEGIRDSLGQGKFTHTCGSEGFASTRDENGFSRRSGSWAHAMAYIAADDRDIIKRKYGGPLVLVLNSWGTRWNKGPRDILDSSKYVPAAKKQKWIKLGIVNKDTGNIMIPEGSFWAKWSDVARRDSSIFAGVNGWKRQRIESWGTSLLG